MQKSDNQMSYRQFPLPRTVDEETRTVNGIATTEEPVQMPDWDRYEMNDEKLLISGMILPDIGVVPLLDNHNRDRTSDVFGTSHDFLKKKDELHFLATFSDDDVSDKAYKKLQQGHLRDFSIGYNVLEQTYIPPGESAVINGNRYTASAECALRVVTKWELHEVSLTPIGADERAKVRSLFLSKKEQAMPNTKQATTPEATPAVTPVAENPINNVNIEQVKAEAGRKAVDAELERQRTIRGICSIPGTESMTQVFIDERRSVEEVKDLVLKHLSTNKAPVATGDFEIKSGLTENEKFRSAAVDSLVMRKIGKIDKPADGAQGMSRMAFSDMARECLVMAGAYTRNMSKEEVIKRAFALIRTSGVPSMGTSDFTYILSNSAEKVLLNAFGAARVTWKLWMKKGSLSDFKTYDRVRLSDAPDMDLVYEGGEVNYGKLTDSREQIKLYTYAKNLAFSREALINDDLSAFDPFAMYGRRCALKVEAIAYAPIVNNVAMADTGVLFNTSAVTVTGGHANKAGTGAAPSASTINDGEIAINAQKGPNGSELGLVAKYLIYGMYHKANAFITLNSFALPTAQMSSGVANPMKDEAYNGGYTPILVPTFGSTFKRWFLATDYNDEPNIEVAFLDGVETPTLTENDQSPSHVTGSKVYQALIDVAAKPLSYRGMYENAGE